MLAPLWSLSQIKDTVYDHQLTVKDGVLFLPKEKVKQLKFSENLAGVYVEDSVKHWLKAGFADKKGKFVIFPQYDSIVHPFTGGIAAVGNRTDSGWDYFVIDPHNHLKISDTLSGVGDITRPVFPVRLGSQKWRFYNHEGIKVTSADIDAYRLTCFGKYIVTSKFHEGLFSENGIQLSDVNYKNILEVATDTFDFTSFPKIHFAGNDSTFLAADSIQLDSSGLGVFWISGNAGMLDGLREKSYSLFDSLGLIKHDQYIFKHEIYYGILRNDGQLVVECKYDSIKIEQEFYTCYSNGFKTIIDISGNIKAADVINYQPVGNSFAEIVNESEMHGIIDSAGDTVISARYSFVKVIGENWFAVPSDTCNGCIIIDKDGVMKMESDRCFEYFYGIKNTDPLRYDTLIATDINVFITKKKNKYGLLHEDGEEVIYPLLDSIFYVPEIKEFLVWKQDSLGLVDSSGNFLLSYKGNIDSVGKFHFNMAIIKSKDQYGFLDANGNISISLQYPKAKEFANGFAPVVLKGKWAYLNKQEEIVAQPHYDDLSVFYDSVGIGRIGNKWLFINTSGKPVNSFTYDSIRAVNDGRRFLVYRKGLAGLAAINGHEVFGPKYDKLYDLENGYVIAMKDGKYGVLDNTETFIIPFLYYRIQGLKNLFILYEFPNKERRFFSIVKDKRK